MSRLSRWYARRFVCPFWGCKPPDLYDYHGKFDKIAGTIPRCENCGEVIPVGGTPGRTAG